MAALLFASPTGVDLNYVHGNAVVKNGRLVGVDLPEVIQRQNAAAARLLENG